MPLRTPCTPHLVLLSGLVVLACDGDFEDDRQSLIKKPELLSVVLEPPEARPGEQVQAAFLLADSRGVLAPTARVWLPGDISAADPAGHGPSGAWIQGVKAALPGLDLTWEQLWADTLTFSAPALTGGAQKGRSPLSLEVQVGPACAGSDPSSVLLDELPVNLACGAVRLGLRSVPLSTAAVRNRNPVVIGITVVDSAGARTAARLARSADADLATARAAAADHPVPLDAESEVTLEVTAADADDPAGESLTYQWISTGGDFGGYRLARQPWTVPGHRTAGTGVPGRTAGAGVDPRTDPNLHPVWLILRDGGGATGVAGQSWAELYVRVLPGTRKE